MIRTYRFEELMYRLKSPFWGVTKVGRQYVFIPIGYI